MTTFFDRVRKTFNGHADAHHALKLLLEAPVRIAGDADVVDLLALRHKIFDLPPWPSDYTRSKFLALSGWNLHEHQFGQALVDFFHRIDRALESVADSGSPRLVSAAAIGPAIVIDQLDPHSRRAVAVSRLSDASRSHLCALVPTSELPIASGCRCLILPAVHVDQEGRERPYSWYTADSVIAATREVAKKQTEEREQRDRVAEEARRKREAEEAAQAEANLDLKALVRELQAKVRQLEEARS